MTLENLKRALRGFVRRVPFRAFLLEFMTGEKLTISHPEAVHFDGELLVFISPQLRYRVFDCHSVNQLRDID